MTASFLKVATVQASTKRPAPIVGGKAGDAVTSIASLKVTPIIPASRELVIANSLETTTGKLFETWTIGSNDVKTSDVLVVGASEYPIRAVNTYPFKSETRKQMIIEEMRR